MLTPIDVGLPAHFQDWRKSQYDIADWITSVPVRFAMLCAPTGAGKSLMYMAAAAMSGLRTVCLTSTKGLQDQLNADFESISADIRGMQNYSCDMAVQFGFPAHTRVADAPCQAGARCPMQSGGCGYFDQYRRAQKADIVVTNYQCWMHDSRKRWGLGSERPVEMLVCDESHDCLPELSNYLGTVLERKECLAMGVTWPISGYKQEEWQDWAGYWMGTLRDKREELEAQVKEGPGAGFSLLHEIKESKKLERKLERVAEMQDEWVIEEEHRHGDSMKEVRFDPLWPKKYRETLFRGVPKVVLVSATVRPKTAELLGIPEGELEFREYQSSFPVRNRPVIHVPTVRMNFHNERDDSVMMWWLRKIDLLVGARADRKGVVHTVCLAPETRVLTADLRWDHAGNVRQGDLLVGFDEHPPFHYKSCGFTRQWRESVVEEAELIDAPCLRITLEDGTIFTCSENHLWLTHNTAIPRWTQAYRLQAGARKASYLMKVIDPWNDDYGWKEGYLSAAFDGEGSLAQGKMTGTRGNRGGWSLNFSQKNNCMLRKVRELLEEFDFSHHRYPEYEGKVTQTARVYGKANVIRFLGQVRPDRLLDKFDLSHLGKFGLLRRVRVIGVERVGKKKVAMLQTSTSTFIAEGFASHNSYKRARFILDNSVHADRMLIHGSDNRASVIERFKRAGAGTVLLSPSVDTGYDFAGEIAEYQIIAKLPFPDTRGAVMKARCSVDKEYSSYLTAQTLQQMTGRVCRSETDRGETLVIDDNAQWFTYRNKEFFNKWWMDSYRSQKGKLPEPLEKLAPAHSAPGIDTSPK